MITETKTPIADALEGIGSHSIVDLGHATGLLRAAGYTGPMPNGYTHDQTMRQINDRGLGGGLAKEDYPGQKYIAGFQLAPVVVCSVTGAEVNPGSQYFGRGSSFRADVAAIRAWEENR